MPDNGDWLFEAIWDLSDRANVAGFPGTANKLEEAMDALLEERGQTNAVLFRSRRDTVARRQNMIAQLREDLRAGQLRAQN